MGLLKYSIPYALLFLADSYYMHMEITSYLLVCLLMLWCDIRSLRSGYKAGFHNAERIGFRVFKHLAEVFGMAEFKAALDKFQPEE